MNINDHIVYVKIDKNKKIELTKDRLDINQTLDYMYIAWFWIKYNSFKTIDHTWKNHKNDRSEELIGSSIYQCNLLFDVVTGFMSACYLFVIDKVKNLVDQFGIAKENEETGKFIDQFAIEDNEPQITCDGMHQNNCDDIKSVSREIDNNVSGSGMYICEDPLNMPCRYVFEPELGLAELYHKELEIIYSGFDRIYRKSRRETFCGKFAYKIWKRKK